MTISSAPRSRAGGFSSEGLVRSILESAGIQANGTETWDPRINDQRFWNRVAMDGMLGLGDSYVDRWWDSDDIPEFFNRAIRGRLLVWTSRSHHAILKRIRDWAFNPQNPRRAVANVKAHYTERDELVLGMLGPWNAYSCAFFEDPEHPAEGLAVAEARKLELICRKLSLNSSDRFLDIGCGWGSLLGYAQKHYGVKGDGITPAPNQAAFVSRTYGLTVYERDYRRIDTHYDRIASVGMYEHVGPKNARTYMETVNRSLNKNGLFLLHFFGRPSADIPLLDTWTDRYIFPGAYLPTSAETHAAAEGLLEIVHQDEWGRHYDPTLCAWERNFEEYAVREGLKERNQALYRMWRYYLLSAAGAFRSGDIALWQMVFKKRGSRRVYSFS